MLRNASMNIHFYNANSGKHTNGEWTSHASACKPRGAATGALTLRRYRVTDESDRVTCKACIRIIGKGER